MTKTTNYQLNQWDPTDRVLRTDFNSDNQKIDAAIAEAKAASSYVKIKELTVSTAAAAVDLDVSDVDFSQFMKVELFFQCPEQRSVSVRVNNLSSGYLSIALSGTGSRDPGSLDRLAAFPGYSYGALLFYTPHPQGKVGCVNITYDGSTSYSGSQLVAPCTWSALTSFNFTASSGKLPVGTYIALFGVRK